MHAFHILGAILLTDALNQVAGGTCPVTNVIYPASCPRPEDPPSHTKCCRYNKEPACCEERATTVCGVKTNGSPSHRGRFTSDPGPDYAVVYCPQPGEPDDNIICSFRSIGGSVTINCDSRTLVYGIIGGVAGLLLLIGVITTALCWYKLKSGQWHCEQVRPGKYKFVPRRRMSPQWQSEAHNTTGLGTNPNVSDTNTQPDYFTSNYGIGVKDDKL